MLATGFESVDDLKEIGVKPIQARTLFKSVLEWNANGVSSDIVTIAFGDINSRVRIHLFFICCSRY